MCIQTVRAYFPVLLSLDADSQKFTISLWNRLLGDVSEGKLVRSPVQVSHTILSHVCSDDDGDDEDDVLGIRQSASSTSPRGSW